MLPLFKTHYSIGKSILTLEDPKKTVEGGPDSVFKIAKDNGLSKLVLVEDSLVGFFEAFKRSKELGVQLVFGLRLSMRNSAAQQDANTDHKVIIFAKTANGCKLLNKIYSKAFVEFAGFLDYASLKQLWSADDLKLCVPFYDSFLHKNLLEFSNCVPDYSWNAPIFFVEKNGVSIDAVLKSKVSEYCMANGFKMQLVKSIYYKNRSDVLAFQTYKIICTRTAGKTRSLQKPEMPHFCSNEFCFESWKEEENATL